MSDQFQMKSNRIRRFIITASLVTGFIAVTAFLVFNLQASRQQVVAHNAGLEDFIEPPAFIYLEDSDQTDLSTCSVTELGIPLVRHPHWLGNDQDSQASFYDGAFMHDLFYRANCPN